MKKLAVIEPFWRMPSISDPMDLQGWRDWLVDSMLFLTMFGLPLAMLVTLPVFIEEKRYELIAIDVAILLVIVFRYFVKTGSFKTRGALWIVTLYIMTISFYVVLGPHYARSAWLILLVVMSALLFGTRAAIVAIILNMVILMTLYWTMDADSSAWANVYGESFSKWIMFVVNVSVLSISCGLPVGFLLKKLDISLKHERESTQNLSEESEKLQHAYDVLQRETQERKEAEVELVESQQRYQSLFNSKTNLVFVIDKGGMFLDANNLALELFGYAKEDLSNLNFLHLLHPDQPYEEVTEAIEEILKTGSQKGPIEVKLKSKDGETIYVHSGGTLIPGKNEIIGVARDITGQKLTEAAKQTLESQLLQAQKMEAIGTLAGGIAHDFNNSLQGILGYIQILLLDMQSDAPEVNKLRQVEASALRAGELTRQLLTFSRKIESKLHPVNLNQEVRPFEKLLRRIIPRMIDIELHLEGNLPVINADSSQIEQLLMNLSINARDAMPLGGKLTIETENMVLDEVYCRTHLGTVPGDYVVLSISDNGSGIDKETLRRIYDPFYTTKDQGKGTGLGLAMVYGIVKSHGGHIVCQSEFGQGTTFKIFFPEIEEVYAKHPGQQEKVKMVGGTETILLVDDEESLRDLGKVVLRRFGYTVLEASDGESALEVYRENGGDISLVILDLIMPGMGGQKCLEKILKADPSQKVIIASGYSADASTRSVLQMGAKSYIEKPFQMGKLLSVVRQVLDRE